MLEAISIRNIVLIDELHIDFREGLCVLTGETGAGKSILLDALGLALGARAEARLLRQGTDQAQVSAQFRLPPSHPVWEELNEQDIPYEENTLLFRRLLKADGKSQCFLNDQLISQPLMRRLGQALVEIHGQFDRLLEPKSHILALDAYGKVNMALTQQAFKDYQETKVTLQAFEEALSHSFERQTFLQFAIKDIEQLNPQPGEMVQLEQEKGLIAHRAKLAEALQFAEKSLSPLMTPLSQSHKQFSRIQEYLPEKISPLLEATDRALLEVQDVLEGVIALKRESMDASLTLEKVEDRLHSLRALSRKYQCEDLPACLMGFKAELASLDQGEDHSLEVALSAEFTPLKLESVHFRVHLEERPEEGWKGAGMDQVEFYIQTNPDTPEGPLGTIASGGELARLMLALKVVLAQSGTLSTLIFDEIESGTGGAVASAMGERLKKLSQTTQILAITHSPQIASQGNHHLRVLKKLINGKTTTHLQSLSEEERFEEIARMLAGHAITDEARAAAKRLMA